MTAKYSPIRLSAFLLMFCSLVFAQSTIQGVVKDNVGNGMEDVNVRVAISGSARMAKTDKDGHYAIADVPPGAYTITFEADRYVPINKQVTVPASGTVSVDTVMNPEETVGARQPGAASLIQLGTGQRTSAPPL